jgi:hypothetical protein
MAIDIQQLCGRIGILQQIEQLLPSRIFCEINALEKNNVMGLVYALYSSGDVVVQRAAA